MMTALTYRDVLVNQGGLMRCCLATLADFVEAHTTEPAVEGFVLDCAYETPGNARMILQGKVFRWNHPADLGPPTVSTAALDDRRPVRSGDHRSPRPTP